MIELSKAYRQCALVMFANGVFGASALLVLKPLTGMTYQTLFCCLIGMIAGYGFARLKTFGRSNILKAFLYVLFVAVFIISLRMHESVVNGVLTSCERTLFCSAYVALFWAFMLYVSVGLFASMAGLKVSTLMR